MKGRREVYMSFRSVNYRSAIVAGIIGTIVMIVVFTLFGMNALWGLGTIAGSTGGGAYAVGMILHLVFGVVYAVIYAMFVEKWLRSLPRALAGATYSLFPFIIAVLFIMPFVNGLDVMYDTSKAAPCQKYMEADTDCEECEMHKKMPYKTHSNENGMMVICQPDDSSMCATSHMFCLGEFLGRLLFGITLGLLYRPITKK